MTCSSNTNEVQVPIADNEHLWRRISPSLVVYDDNLKRERPMTGAFKDRALSVYIAQIVYGSGRTPENLLTRKLSKNGLVSFTAGFARDLGQKVFPNPPQKGDTETDPAHGLVEGRKNKLTQHAFATRCEWVKLPDTS